MSDPRTAHWFERRDMSPHLEPEESAALTEYFDLLLANHTVEESITAIQQMWPTVIYGEYSDYDGEAVVL